MPLAFPLRSAAALIAIALALPAAPAAAQPAGALTPAAVEPAVPDAGLAAELFAAEASGLSLLREDAPPPAWAVRGPGGPVGYIASSWEITRSVGYSGKPIDILVAVSPEGRIAGARLMRHNEPVLTLGISDQDIAAYVAAFEGLDLAKPRLAAFEARDDVPDIISRATVTTGVIRDALIRTARAVALGRGLIGGGGARVDRASLSEKSWQALVADGDLAHTRVSLAEARAALAGAKVPVPSGDAPFIELWAGILDPPTIGVNLIGRRAYDRVMAGMGPDDAALFVASRGLHSHRGTAWRQSGVFDRIELIQDEKTIALSADDYMRIDELAADGAPELKEISVFRVPGASGFDPVRGFRLAARVERETADGGTVSLRVPLDHTLPRAHVLPAPDRPEGRPLWEQAWEAKRWTVAGVALMLAVLAGILFLQEPLSRRRRLWSRIRTGYLAVTLVWLGWIAGGQLSVVQVVAFLQSLLTGFRWETFLIEPVIFLLWSFVALGLLFWGRGVFCGWLCPFGALQELTNRAAQHLGVPQLRVPFAVHERLWAIKYTLFLGILGLSFYSMQEALVLAEVEPFKTAISMRFMRAWPFVAFVVALLAAGLFIERFYCRYLCPLGAALAIPAKLKLFDWLRRRPQCGRECRICETKCMVQAIDPMGAINPNECVLCLHCQAVLHDHATCPVLKRRARRPEAG
ncbi:MAG TPA: 4Fe-4S binding protein [Thermohalobaculum sp.]|nr:4Fe-4S binding protein [Thermohalobaculum sp.]